MLAAMIVYVLCDDLAWRPSLNRSSRLPKGSGARWDPAHFSRRNAQAKPIATISTSHRARAIQSGSLAFSGSEARPWHMLFA